MYMNILIRRTDKINSACTKVERLRVLLTGIGCAVIIKVVTPSNDFQTFFLGGGGGRELLLNGLVTQFC